MTTGRYEISVGGRSLTDSTRYEFFSIYLRDFAPDKQAWIESDSVGKHFEISP